jgi:antitoxin component YwqK of YwqJK toxin-antitoxin module
MKLLLTSLFMISVLSYSQSTEEKQIEKEIEIITECEIVSLLGNFIELRTVIDLNVKPIVNDSAYAKINSIYINDKGYRAKNEKSLGLIFKESLKSNTTLIKHFTLIGEIDYIKKNFRIGESIPISWKTKTEVTHYIEKTKDGETILEGYYIDGISVAEERYINKEGHLVVTNNSLGLLHGVQLIYDNNIKITEANWFMGELDGFVTEWFLNGQISTNRFFIDDTKEGHAVSYYESGQLKKSNYYYGDKAHGQNYFYFESGKLMDDAQYKNGEYHGLVTKYYENGIIRFQDFRVDGVSDGNYLRNYASGKVEVNTFFVKGKLHGNYIDYYETGKNKSKGEYANDEKIGKWTYWNKDGKKTVEKFDPK